MFVILVLFEVVVVLLLALLDLSLQIFNNRSVRGPFLTQHIDRLLQTLVLRHGLVEFRDREINFLLLRLNHDLDFLLIVLPRVFQVLDLLALVFELSFDHRICLLDAEQTSGK